MENKESIEQILDKMENSNIKKQTVSPITALLILASGVMFFFINYFIEFEPKSIFPPMLILISFGLTLWGILGFIFRKKIYVESNSKQRLQVNELHFDVKERDKLVRIMETKNYEELPLLENSTHDGLKLRYMTTKDATLCFSQVIAYIPYEFVRITTVQQHLADDAKKISQHLSSTISKKAN